MTLLRSAVGFGIGHAEHVVGFNAAAHSGVARDWLSESEALLFLFNSIEHIDSFFNILACLLFSFALGAGSKGIVDVLDFTAKEGGNGLGRHGLLQINVSIH